MATQWRFCSVSTVRWQIHQIAPLYCSNSTSYAQIW